MKTINFKGYQVKTISLKEGLCNQILTEVYKKSDKSLFLSFFRNLRDYFLDKKTKKDFEDFNTKNHFGLFQIESGLSGYYDIAKNKTVFLLDKNILDSIKLLDGEELYGLADYVWTAFVHEDTHFQQQNKIDKSMSKKGLKPLKINKNYIQYDPDLPYDLNIERNVKYFSNQYEVDALAREVGEKLRILYNLNGEKDEKVVHKTVKDIFKDIKNNNLPKSNKIIDAEEIKKVINIYWDPRINKNVKLDFFGTLFEYLYEREDQKKGVIEEFLINMILKEQFLKNKGRILWRGSKYKEWKSGVFCCPYVSTQVLYALNFSKDFDKPIVENAKYLSQFVIKKPLNLFNARSQKDCRILEDFFRKNKMHDWLESLPLLADNDWLDVFEIEERECLIEILKELGFEGFVNIEGNSGKTLRNAFYTLNISVKNDLYGFDGVGVFDFNNLMEVKTLQSWNEIKKEFAVQLEINSAKNEVLKNLFENWEIYKNNLNLFVKDSLKNVRIWNFLTEKEIEELYKNFDYENFKNNFEKEKLRLKENYRQLPVDYLKLYNEKVQRSFLNRR